MIENKWNYKYLLPAFFYAALIFFLSSLPSSAIPNLGISFGDLILHFFEYSGFGYFVALAIMQSPSKINWKNFLMVFFIGSLYAASDEYHQSFVEGRFSEVSDFLADSTGVILGLVVFVIRTK
ncbi:VanZ family protein [candidate division KSB1 bacterium]|nr:VanZ family protein [candidate division KSB1 bacterium]